MLQFWGRMVTENDFEILYGWRIMLLQFRGILVTKFDFYYLPATGRQIPKITYSAGAVMLPHFLGRLGQKVTL